MDIKVELVRDMNDMLSSVEDYAGGKTYLMVSDGHISHIVYNDGEKLHYLLSASSGNTILIDNERKYHLESESGYSDAIEFLKEKGYWV